MSIWLIRAGSHGEHETKFGVDNRVYVTWDRKLPHLAKLSSREALFAAMTEAYPEAKPKTVHNWVSQVWPFAHEIKKGDLVVLPLKSQPSVAIGEITGDYRYEPNGPAPFYHWRQVKWLGDAIPRTHFRQDLLHSFGAFMTICRIRRNDAEERIQAMRESDWGPDPLLGLDSDESEATKTDDALPFSNLEEQGRDQISQLIAARFKEHEFTRLVDAVLRAQGYTTHVSPAGPDGGADILAGNGIMGFGSNRLVVEVKSGATPIDRPTVDKLLGAISKFGASEALFVSRSGYKSNVQRELATSYFKVRLWTLDDLLAAIFANYDKLDEDIRAELPLKRVWTVATPEEE